ncbi:MAG: hypothetical protein RIK87_16505 [Fuerstiella sp.]
MINRMTDSDSSTERSLKHRGDATASPVMGKCNLSAEGLITKHPGLVLAAGVALGLAVGWWVKRR